MDLIEEGGGKEKWAERRMSMRTRTRMSVFNSE